MRYNILTASPLDRTPLKATLYRNHRDSTILGRVQTLLALVQARLSLFAENKPVQRCQAGRIHQRIGGRFRNMSNAPIPSTYMVSISSQLFSVLNSNSHHISRLEEMHVVIGTCEQHIKIFLTISY